MKKKFVTMALFAIIGAMASSCQKENVSNLSPVATNASETYMITYSVDNVSMQIVVNGDEELQDFLRMLTALAREGHNVTIRNGNIVNSSLSKERVEYRTKNEDDANAWVQKMIKEGYEVTMDYDSETGEFICVAIK